MTNKVLVFAGVFSALLVVGLVYASIVLPSSNTEAFSGYSGSFRKLEKRIIQLETLLDERVTGLENRLLALSEIPIEFKIQKSSPTSTGSPSTSDESSQRPSMSIGGGHDLLVRLESLEDRLRSIEEDPIQRAFNYLESTDPNLRRQGVFSLEKLAKNDPEAKKALKEMLQDKDPHVRQAALDTLSDIDAKDTLHLIPAMLDDPSKIVRLEAVTALSRLGGREYAQDLVHLASDADETVRLAAVDALGHLKYEGGSKVLIEALQDKNEDVRGKAITSLGKIGAREAVGELRKLLDDDSGQNRTRLILSLNQLGDSQPYKNEVKRLSDQVLTHESSSQRRSALRELGKFDRKDYIEILKEARKDSDREVRRTAEWLLRKRR